MLLWHARKSPLTQALRRCLIQQLNCVVKDPNSFHCSVSLRMLTLTSDWPCLVTDWACRSSRRQALQRPKEEGIVSSSYVLREQRILLGDPPAFLPTPQLFARNGSDSHPHVNHCQKESDLHLFLGLWIRSFLLESCGKEVDLWTQLGVCQHGYCGVKE